MDDEAHAEPELCDGLTDEGKPEGSESPGTFFPKARHFVVTGGTFTNIIRPAPTVLSGDSKC
ncbi:hypothetical protein C8J57DRAFT_1528582 [Mycena rebaudengoi]|nr:hypothetical protein C8J57DRAFT_1528582 [Mycena rebaudengoi]